jgi:hypothetical protein
MEPPWIEAPSIELDAAVPAMRRYDHAPEPLVERGRALLASISERFPPSYRHLATVAALRTGYRFNAEAKGLAHRVGTDWQRIFVANLSYDLVIAYLGCSTMALATPDGPVLARNMDWAPEGPLARASVRIDLVRNGRLLHRTANWPGGIGVVTGLSARGFAVALNAVFHPAGFDRLGYPVLLFLRTLLDDATGFDDALKRLRTQRLAAAGLFTLVGRENSQRVVVERSPREAAIRRAVGDEPLVTTNHYQAFEIERGPLAYGLTGTSAERCSALTDLVAGTDGRAVEDSRLLFALSDPAVRQQITAQHVVARPAEDSLRLYVLRDLVVS